MDCCEAYESVWDKKEGELICKEKECEMMMMNCKEEYKMLMNCKKKDYMMLKWCVMEKRINDMIEGVNESNLRRTIEDLSSLDLKMGRGLVCKALLRAQSASPVLTPLYAALVAGINVHFPEVGDLLLNRLLFSIRLVYHNFNPYFMKQEDVIVVVKFLAHLLNQRVADPRIAIQLIICLAEDISRDYDVAVCLFTECAPALRDIGPGYLYSPWSESDDGHDAKVDETIKVLVQELFAIRDKYQDSEVVRPELDVVKIEDQITLYVDMFNGVDPEDELDNFPA